VYLRCSLSERVNLPGRSRTRSCGFVLINLARQNTKEVQPSRLPRVRPLKPPLAACFAVFSSGTSKAPPHGTPNAFAVSAIRSRAGRPHAYFSPLLVLFYCVVYLTVLGFNWHQQQLSHPPAKASVCCLIRWARWSGKRVLPLLLPCAFRLASRQVPRSALAIVVASIGCKFIGLAPHPRKTDIFDVVLGMPEGVCDFFEVLHEISLKFRLRQFHSHPAFLHLRITGRTRFLGFGVVQDDAPIPQCTACVIRPLVSLTE